MIRIYLYRQIEESFEPFLIDLSTTDITREENTKREHIGHFHVVHLHIGTYFAGRLFWIKCSETVDDILGLRTIGHDSLTVEKVTPFQDYLRHSLIATHGPVVKNWIQ